MKEILKVGSVVLPAPVKISVSDEIIWSSNTGRSSTGKMIGDVIAEKKTIDIEWGVLTESEMALISNNLKSGFRPLTFRDEGVMLTINTYRGTLKKEQLGYVGNIFYYRSASVSVIQQ